MRSYVVYVRFLSNFSVGSCPPTNQNAGKAVWWPVSPKTTCPPTAPPWTAPKHAVALEKPALIQSFRNLYVLVTKEEKICISFSRTPRVLAI